MTWRPEDWARCRRLWFHNSARSELLDGLVYEAGADALLEALSSEIEKVENPYDLETFISICQHKAYEDCREEILSLLRPVENPVGSVDL